MAAGHDVREVGAMSTSSHEHALFALLRQMPKSARNLTAELEVKSDMFVANEQPSANNQEDQLIFLVTSGFTVTAPESMFGCTAFETQAHLTRKYTPGSIHLPRPYATSSIDAL